MNRRYFCLSLAALGGMPKLGFALTPAATPPQSALIGAAWRGPNSGDTYQAGALAADWDTRKLAIRYEIPLPTRPHGLLPEADGGLLVIGVRPGAWMLRCDGNGKLMQQISLSDEFSASRLNGHAVVAQTGEVIFTTETDSKTGRGKIGVRDRLSLRKLDEWETHGIDPHQLVLDDYGQLYIANGGVPRTAADKKYDLQRMDSSLVKLDAKTGRLLQQWQRWVWVHP